MAKKESFFKKYKSIIIGIVITLLWLTVWRISVHIPLPFLNYENGQDSNESLFGFLDMFSGGALSSFSIAALGISPYITSSIVVQLLQMDIIPQFKEWAEEGEAGKEKLNRWTRYIALFLAFVQALALVIGYKANYGTQWFVYIENMNYNSPFIYIFISLVITAGTGFVLWLADQITMKGVGNGSSLLIVAGIIAGFPTMISAMYKFFITGEYSEYYWNLENKAGNPTTAWGYVFFVLMILFFVLIICGVVWMESLVRKIPIQYSNRPAAAKIRGNQDSNMPIKLNSASVIPVIFASTLLSLPTTILNFVTETGAKGGWVTWLERIFNYDEPIGYAIYIVLIFVFAFFYSFLQIDPDKVADNLKKNNAYIPGVKPGEATAQFISKTLFKVTLLGATYLAVLASLPIIVSWCFSGVGQGLPAAVQIGGTSLMIVVGVALETVKQIKTQAQSQEYKGFLK